MKYFYSISFILFFALTSQAQIQGYSLNDVVDDFTVTDIHGEVHNLYTYTAAGKYVFIDFSFVACSPCQALSPIFNEFYDKYGCNAGEVVCMSLFGLVTQNDTNADVETFENTHGGTFNHAPAISIEGGAGPVDLDFNPSAYPTVCLINPDNEILNLDIWPINDVADIEAAFPTGFNPSPMSCDTSSVDDINQEMSFTVYPNPFDGKELKINLTDSKTGTIRIHNILGAKVFQTKLNTSSQTIHPDLITGTYFITIQTNTKKLTHQLIVY